MSAKANDLVKLQREAGNRCQGKTSKGRREELGPTHVHSRSRRKDGAHVVLLCGKCSRRAAKWARAAKNEETKKQTELFGETKST